MMQREAQHDVDMLHRTIDGKAYLNLPSGVNWSEYFPLRTEWNKSRILEDGLKQGSKRVTVDMTDFLFASSNCQESYAHSLKVLEWGIAMDCRPGITSETSYPLNLKGTPFRLGDW